MKEDTSRVSSVSVKNSHRALILVTLHFVEMSRHLSFKIQDEFREWDIYEKNPIYKYPKFQLN